MKREFIIFAAGLFLVAGGCAHGLLVASPPTVNQAWSSAGVSPSIIQSGQTGSWRFFAYPPAIGVQQLGIVVGPDKNIWIAETTSSLIRVTMKAKITIFSRLTGAFGGVNYQIDPGGMVLGPDSRFWMTVSQPNDVSGNGLIAAITTAGAVTLFETPGEPESTSHLVMGPDGKLWVPLSTHMARISTAGSITQYAYPSKLNSGYANDVTVGPDNNIWFTEGFVGIVGKIVPSTGMITEYPISGTTGGPCRLNGIVNGGDGNLYAVGGNCLVADEYEVLRIATSGSAAAVATLPLQPPFSYGMMRGPDGNIWIPNESTQQIMIYGVKQAKFLTTIPSPSSVKCTSGVLATGPDGNIWDVGVASGVSIYLRKILTVTPTKLSLSAAGKSATLQGSETGNPTLTAVSSNTAVAKVAPGTTFNSFVVTATGIGKATITITDGKGNYFNVPVDVL